MSPYANYGTPQQQQQAPHRSHSSLSHSNQQPFMGSPSSYPQQQQQQNPSSSSSNNNNNNAFPPQSSQMLPPASTASPRPSSKRKHRASTGPGGGGGTNGSPLVANAAIPSPAQQSRPNPMAMGGYDLSALANGFPGGMNQQQQQAQLQVSSPSSPSSFLLLFLARPFIDLLASWFRIKLYA